MSSKKPSRCENKEPEFASNTNQLSSTIISLFSNLIVTKVPVAILMLLTLYCWETPPGFTITNAPTLGAFVAGKNCFGAAASLSSMDFFPWGLHRPTWKQHSYSKIFFKCFDWSVYWYLINSPGWISRFARKHAYTRFHPACCWLFTHRFIFIYLHIFIHIYICIFTHAHNVTRAFEVWVFTHARTLTHT